MVMAATKSYDLRTEENIEAFPHEPGKIFIEPRIAKQWGYSQQVYEECRKVWGKDESFKLLMREFINTIQERCAQPTQWKKFGIRRLATMCKNLHQDKKLKDLWLIEKEGPTISPTTLGSVNTGKMFPSLPVMQFLASLYIKGENNEFIWEPWSPDEFLLYIKGEIDIQKMATGSELAIAEKTSSLDYLDVVRNQDLGSVFGLIFDSFKILGSRLREEIDRREKAETALAATQLRWKSAEQEVYLLKHGVQSSDVNIELFRLKSSHQQYLKSLFQGAMRQRGVTEEDIWRKAGLSPQLGLADGDRRSISFNALFAIAPQLGVSSQLLLSELQKLNELENVGDYKPK